MGIMAGMLGGSTDITQTAEASQIGAHCAGVSDITSAQEGFWSALRLSFGFSTSDIFTYL